MKILKITIILFLGICSFAQAQIPALTGIWNQTEKTQLSGTEYANAIPVKLQYTIADKELSLTRTEVSPDEHTLGTVSTEKLLLEKGKAVTGQTTDRRTLITATDWNGQILTETKTISQSGKTDVQYRIKEVSTISQDGKTLTLVKEFENLGDTTDKWQVKGIYEKGS